MLKTTAGNPARYGTFSKALITYAVLSEYVRNPLRFLMGTALTPGRFKKSLPKDLPKDFVELFAYPTWIYLRLKQKLGQEKAFALSRAIILPLGLAVYGASSDWWKLPAHGITSWAFSISASGRAPFSGAKWKRRSEAAQSVHIDAPTASSMISCPGWGFPS
jgi:hypothetical protein